MHSTSVYGLKLSVLEGAGAKALATDHLGKDREFVKCKLALEKKARALCEKGYGKGPNATTALTVQDEQQLWKNRVLRENKPKSLLYTLWHLICSISFIFVFEVAKSTMTRGGGERDSIYKKR